MSVFNNCIIYYSSWRHKTVGGDEYSPLPGESGRELTRPKVEAGDAGWYKCEATNHGGSAEGEMFINVLCK